ncbi:MAG: short-chain dehydrogenase, partial [Pseudomonadota bacterium]
MRFQNKKALVTGAAGGIGSAIVSQLRSEGA